MHRSVRVTPDTVKRHRKLVAGAQENVRGSRCDTRQLCAMRFVHGHYARQCVDPPTQKAGDIRSGPHIGPTGASITKLWLKKVHHVYSAPPLVSALALRARRRRRKTPRPNISTPIWTICIRTAKHTALRVRDRNTKANQGQGDHLLLRSHDDDLRAARPRLRSM